MKRVKSACVLQTLIFSQRPEMGYTKEHATILNHEEVENYKKALEKAHTKYQILDKVEQPDGSVLVHVKKQYNDKIDVSEYFN